MIKKLRIKGGKYFSFRSTIYSHGWADLLPFKLAAKNLTLEYVIPIHASHSIKVKLNSESDKEIIITTKQELGTELQKIIISKIRHVFRLNEDLSDFYNIAKNNENYRWILQIGAGRLLRCASLWEDMVKMLCTTNCTWRLTQIMVENLVTILGSNTFPSAEIVANKDEKFLREKIKMGYRAPFLLEFAQNVVSGDLNLAKYENWSGDSESLYKELRKIKGFGDYAVGNLMKLLGRYDFMGFDSWNRKQFAIKHNKENSCPDKQITQFYSKYGKWAGLFFWMDITEDWYRKEQPW